MKRRWKFTIRVRLTLLYAGAFFLAGLVLVTVLYLYFGHSLDHQLSSRLAAAKQLHTQAHNVSPEVVDQLRTQYQQDHDDNMRALLIASLVSLGAVAAAAGGFGWLLAGRALRPLQRITATARRVADRSLHQRIALEGPDDEIKDLADTFDAMLQRLDRAFDSQRRFVANASHELRTPLTINRALIEVALDDPHADQPLRLLGAHLLAVNERQQRLIDGLLTLASSEEHLSTRDPVDLAEIARRIADSQTAAHRAGVEIITGLAPAPVEGDPILLERLAHNLLDNAIRYNIPEDGWAKVITGTDDGDAYITVENSGPIVASDEIPSLFEPFRRPANADRRATVSGDHGAGLGLSIVRSVAHAHGGDVHATPRPDGGLIVRVRLPARIGTGEAGALTG
ncbi:MAG TPA: HAMP domain-containing sensor histidine kinase [Micromonosporaceae bacterium]|jgi:signal transduction histidine kinase